MIVGENLKQLIKQNSIAPESCFDTNSITLHLANTVKIPKDTDKKIIYPVTHVESFFDEKKFSEDFLVEPNTCILACSDEYIRMPNNFFGLVQTKGSLARLFCCAHLSDGQVDGGYEGAITLEICNHGPFPIALRHRAPIAQLFLFSTSSEAETGYRGRYGGQRIPTIFTPKVV